MFVIRFPWQPFQACGLNQLPGISMSSPFQLTQLCVLSHHPVTSSPNSTLNGNVILGKHGWVLLPEALNIWFRRQGRMSALDLGLGLLDLWGGFHFLTSPWGGISLGPAMEVFDLWSHFNLKIGIGPTPGEEGTVTRLKHSKPLSHS